MKAEPPIPREASARGGRRKTAKKLNAMAHAQGARRRHSAARIAALKVPVPFADVRDFLTNLRELLDQFPLGTHGEIAERIGVSGSSTVRKYLLLKKFPTQGKLDKLAAWWKAHRNVPSDATGRKPHAPAAGPRAISLSKLTPAVTTRLHKAARLRNVSPLQLADQILERHLPSLDDLARAER
jgi:hypothetical protein